MKLDSDVIDGWHAARTTGVLLAIALGVSLHLAGSGCGNGSRSARTSSGPPGVHWVNAHGQNAFRTSPLQGDNATTAAQNPNGKGFQGDKVFAQNSLILVAGKSSLAASSPSPDEYTTNADGTFTDRATGLTWTQPLSMTWEQAQVFLAAHRELDLPTMDQLVSLSNSSVGVAPFDKDSKGRLFTTAPIRLETPDGDMSQPEGKRVIDGQVLSSETAQGSIMGQRPGTSRMGYNFADGRIKAYPLDDPPGSGQARQVRVMFVKKDPAYDRSRGHDFARNSDGTVSERSSGATYTRKDAAGILQDVARDPTLARSWQDFYTARMQDRGTGAPREVNVSGVFDSVEATAFADWANRVNLYGRSDWRIPNLKEMHRATVNDGDPNTPGLDPIFELTPTTDPYTNQPMWGNYQTSDRIADWVPVFGPDGRPARDSAGRPEVEQQVSATYIASGSADGRRPPPRGRRGDQVRGGGGGDRRQIPL